MASSCVTFLQIVAQTNRRDMRRVRKPTVKNAVFVLKISLLGQKYVGFDFWMNFSSAYNYRPVCERRARPSETGNRPLG
jgi:hypothetical protein